MSMVHLAHVKCVGVLYKYQVLIFIVGDAFNLLIPARPQQVTSHGANHLRIWSNGEALSRDNH